MTPIKFYRTASLPELGEIGNFYFLHGDSNSLYLCTDTSGDKNQDYENYSGHTYWESENGTGGGSGSENDPTDSPNLPDQAYLPLTGGTLTGNLIIEQEYHLNLGGGGTLAGDTGGTVEITADRLSLQSNVWAQHLEADTIKKTNGTSEQILMADGSVQLLSDIKVDTSGYLPLTGGTMSGDITMPGETKLIFGDTSVYNNGHLFIDGALQVESRVTADGFTHASHTSDDYVLLAGGGAKLLSEITPDVSGYLPLTGGTMTGDTKFNGASIYFDEDCAALRMNDAGALEIYSEEGITLSGFVECSGSITCASSINAQAFYETSDARKKDIKSDLSLDKCYDLIDKCQTVIYSLKDQTKEQVGMIAQEIEEFFPEVVATDEEGFKSLAYDRLVVICFKVLKDVIKRLEKLEQ